MTNILIVDDEYIKPGLISDYVLSIDKNINITHVTTSQAGRIEIRKNHFDLMFIDINLPSSLGATPSEMGGMDLFDVMILDHAVKMPSNLVFITEKEDSLEKYIKEAEKRGVSLCQFDVSQDIWKTVLSGLLKLTIVRSKKNQSETPSIDIAILTALRDPELTAVLNLPYNWKTKRFFDDPTGYYVGTKVKGEVNLSVVVASASRKGMPSASALAMKMVERFKPKLLVMLGICAGVKDKVGLGDIIIADPAWDWGSGKMAQDLNGSSVFQAAPYQFPLNHHISQIAMELGSEREVITSITSGWTKDFPSGKLKVHVGPLASGSMVLATDSSLDPISLQNREVLGVDMEAYAVMAASDIARFNKPISLVIKSVCDYADSQKSDGWQEYASYTSACFFDKLISNEFFPV